MRTRSGKTMKRRQPEGKKILSNGGSRHSSTNADSVTKEDPPHLSTKDLPQNEDHPHLSLTDLPHKALDTAEQLALKVWDLVHHAHLPAWLKDNDYLVKGHRPELNSAIECFKSIFMIHTETGNIWSHLLGFMAFVILATSFMLQEAASIPWADRLVFVAFFTGAIMCLGFSWLFHTLHCHSDKVSKIFNKLDYCGIALLIMGSFIPWLYYSFYSRLGPMILYMILIVVLGTTCIGISMWDRFASPRFRPVRAGLFIGLGLSAVIPVTHYVITDGFWHAIEYAAFGWLFLMASLYIGGALIYAFRIPERIWPGKFDIWFQSHQIFHVFVVAAAFVHYHGITQVAILNTNMARSLESV